MSVRGSFDGQFTVKETPDATLGRRGRESSKPVTIVSETFTNVVSGRIVVAANGSPNPITLGQENITTIHFIQLKIRTSADETVSHALTMKTTGIVATQAKMSDLLYNCNPKASAAIESVILMEDTVTECVVDYTLGGD